MISGQGNTCTDFFYPKNEKKDTIMEVTENYIYVKVNRFNIVFPNSDELRPGEFPITDWLTKLRIEGKTWQKILWIMLMSMPMFAIGGTLDFTIWLLKKILHKTGEVFSVALHSFGAKILGGLAIAIIVILAAWLIYSGYWRDLFAWLSFQYSSHSHTAA